MTNVIYLWSSGLVRSNLILDLAFKVVWIESPFSSSIFTVFHILQQPIKRDVIYKLSFTSHVAVSGALIYRLFRGEKKKKLKVLHAATMFTAFVLTVFALKAAFDSHNEVLPNENF